MRIGICVGAFIALVLGAGTAGCKGCKRVDEPPASTRPAPHPKTPEEEESDDEEAKEEAQKAELMQPQYWRVELQIVGQGFVTSYDKAIGCGDDGTHSGKACGPHDWMAPVAGYQPAPATLTAIPAPGWQVAKWDAEVHHADGRVLKRRKTSAKDFYINWFRAPYDKNDLEIVTVTFKPIPPELQNAPPVDKKAAPPPSGS